MAEPAAGSMAAAASEIAGADTVAAAGIGAGTAGTAVADTAGGFHLALHPQQVLYFSY